MELAVITAKQVAVLLLLIFAGFACVKTGAVKIEAKKAFSDLLLYLIVPAMVINSYLTEFDPKVLQNLLQSFALSTVLLLLGLVITFLLTLRIDKEKNTPILRFACIFSNAAYMGFPLIQALFGAEGLLYASAQYFIVDRWLCDGQREGPSRRGAAQHPDNAGALVRSARPDPVPVPGQCAGAYPPAAAAGRQHEHTALDDYHRYADCRQQAGKAAGQP